MDASGTTAALEREGNRTIKLARDRHVGSAGDCERFGAARDLGQSDRVAASNADERQCGWGGHDTASSTDIAGSTASGD
jgi:hypothetical protein